MGVARRRVGATLRQEGGQLCFEPQAPLPQQISEYGIGEQAQLAGPHFKGDMAIAEVISRPQQLQGIGGAHQQQRFGGGFHLHQRWTVVAAEPFAGLERLTAGEL
jgi:hypothetical protein